MAKTDLQKIPSVNAILKSPGAQGLIQTTGRRAVTQATRQVLEEIRKKMRTGDSLPDLDVILKEIEHTLQHWIQPSLRPVINASGIIIHTNLGRAPLSDETIQAMKAVSSGYSNLEFNLQNGKRGKRSIHVETILRSITGAENALVVNNNAAAVLLILTTLAKRRKVIIPHTQLVEIGGGFRIPDVMRQSGAKLVGIGTTNRVHLIDYETALEEGAALILNAHHSNYKIIGFTAEPEICDIASKAHQYNVPFVFDLGSGALIDTSNYGLAHEPTVDDAIKAGADVICFSGDKLLGGPQAGIIIGKSHILNKIKRHPLARAVRADKTCLAGIAATLTHYLKEEAESKIPIWKMIVVEPDVLRSRAQFWQKEISRGSVIQGESVVGGGSLPGEKLPTYLLSLDLPKPDRFLSILRNLQTPIIARIDLGKVLFDPRTVLHNQEDLFLSQLKNSLQ